MVTQLKSYLLQSTELQAMLEPQHQYAQDKLGKFKTVLDTMFCFSVDFLECHVGQAIWRTFPMCVLLIYTELLSL